ncbi:arginine--tRNA ligase [Candidatus Parcubacteria bacterium]|nr:arginine--tRNA ligase [Candidatus Parcubacteria bacterium]
MTHTRMSALHQAKQQALREIKTAVGGGFSPSMGDLATPPDPSLGDLAFPCFSLARSLKKNPSEIAVEIAAKIGPKEFIEDVRAQGPYVNFTLSKSFGSAVLAEIAKEKNRYGHSNVGDGKRVMVEFANLNTHKDIHIGHLRNLFLGQTLVNVLNASGYDVAPVAYINDLGAHVAKSVWAIMRFHANEEIPKDERIDFLRRVYLEATNALEEHPSYKEEVAQVFRNLEDQKGEEMKIWNQTWQWSVDFLKDVYGELSLTLEKWYFESELISRTKKIIDELITKGLVVESEGAWIVDLSQEKLGVNLLVKSDGTLLYNAKDLGLALKKEEEYHPHRSVYVVDARQSHALAQLFATLERMGFVHELYHLAYELVTLEDGAMASRTGHVIRYEMFRDRLLAQARASTRERHADWDDDAVERAARGVAFAAMRFGMLRQDVEKKIVFDFDDALSFDGFSGPYLLYTYARIQSLLGKAGKVKAVRDASGLAHPLERRLLVHLSNYPETVFQSSQDYALSRIAHYLYELCRMYSEYYNEVPIARAEGTERAARVSLTMAVGETLKNGLTLMGIETIKEM